jgi:peptidoglycan/xylan/chitin deacetylase (PgdA/CDA1 family)
LEIGLIGFVIGLLLLPLLQFLNIFGGFIIRGILKKRLRLISSGSLFLTFDDGPGDLIHQRLFEILKKYDAKATFFLLGIRAEGQKEKIDEIIKNGHEIANHSFSHLNAFYVDPITIYRDFTSSVAVFENLNVKPKLYRPPYGKMTVASFLQARKNGYNLAFWTHCSGDDVRKLCKPSSVCKEFERDGGGVILLHSNNRTQKERTDFVLKVTEDLLKLAKKMNIETTCMSDIL